MERGIAVTPLLSDRENPIEKDETVWGDMDPIILAETNENLKAMLSQESDLYLPPSNDCIRRIAALKPDLEKVFEVWRRKMCEWCFSVVDHFSFDREVVSFAMDYLDRVTAAQSSTLMRPLSQGEFQLWTIASLYLAIKLHAEFGDRGGARKKLSLRAYVELSRGNFKGQVIEQTEREILRTLNWRVNPPTSLSFVIVMLRLCPKWVCKNDASPYSKVMCAIFDIARYITELTVCISAFSFFKQSTIAYASIVFALESLPPTLPLPYAARVALLNILYEKTGLHTSDPEVHQVYKQLEQLRPLLSDNEDHILSDDHSSEESGGEGSGNPSPVNVVDTPIIAKNLGSHSSSPINNQEPVSNHTRKRSRSDDRKGQNATNTF